MSQGMLINEANAKLVLLKKYDLRRGNVIAFLKWSRNFACSWPIASKINLQSNAEVELGWLPIIANHSISKNLSQLQRIVIDRTFIPAVLLKTTYVPLPMLIDLKFEFPHSKAYFLF